MLAFLPLGIVLFFCAITIGEKCNLVFICVSLITNKNKHLFIFFLAVYVLPIPLGCLFIPFAYFFYWSPCLSLKIYQHCYILQILILGLMLQTCPNQFFVFIKCILQLLWIYYSFPLLHSPTCTDLFFSGFWLWIMLKKP